MYVESEAGTTSTVRIKNFMMRLVTFNLIILKLERGFFIIKKTIFCLVVMATQGMLFVVTFLVLFFFLHLCIYVDLLSEIFLLFLIFTGVYVAYFLLFFHNRMVYVVARQVKFLVVVVYVFFGIWDVEVVNEGFF